MDAGWSRASPQVRREGSRARLGVLQRHGSALVGVQRPPSRPESPPKECARTPCPSGARVWPSPPASCRSRSRTRASSPSALSCASDCAGADSLDFLMLEARHSEDERCAEPSGNVLGVHRLQQNPACERTLRRGSGTFRGSFHTESGPRSSRSQFPTDVDRRVCFHDSCRDEMNGFKRVGTGYVHHQGMVAHEDEPVADEDRHVCFNNSCKSDVGSFQRPGTGFVHFGGLPPPEDDDADVQSCCKEAVGSLKVQYEPNIVSTRADCTDNTDNCAEVLLFDGNVRYF